MFENSVSTPPFTHIILSLSRLPIGLSGTLLASWLADGIGLQRGVVLGAAAVSLACVSFAQTACIVVKHAHKFIFRLPDEWKYCDIHESSLISYAHL
jgi:hypothetical protein